MPNPLVSVVMSVFNGEQFLGEAIDSILEQTFEDFEFIIIDDGSTDGSVSLLDNYARQDARIQLYRQANKGLVASLNRGCDLARGKYLARMDADDIALRDRLALQVEFMEGRPDIGVLGGHVEFISAAGKPLSIWRGPLENRAIQVALLHECVLCHPTILMRKNVFCSAGGYRKSMIDAEDYDLWLRVAEHSKLANLNKVILKRRYHPYQISVYRRRQQALSVLAAQAAAAARRSGKPDPVELEDEISPAILAGLGISTAAQQATLSRICLGRIRSMEDAGEHTMALKMFDEIASSSDWDGAESWVIADLQLFKARHHWREARLVKSMLAAGSAIIKRPRLLGRPFKGLLGKMVHSRA